MTVCPPQAALRIGISTFIVVPSQADCPEEADCICNILKNCEDPDPGRETPLSASDIIGHSRNRSRFSEDLDGAGEEIRTPDPIITNDVLYQLSYTGAPIKVGAF
ncbi:hypothetical protein AA3990_0528 [Gluconobacter roseus NBRC 3990]|nr:hypothetical protein AA3990_0528 [Gluconobacter roseus NBRC 3990]